MPANFARSIAEKIKNTFKDFKLGSFLVAIKPYYIGFLIFLFAFSWYHIVFGKRLIPGVYIAGLDMGGRSYDQAVEKLEIFEAQTDKSINVSYEGQNFTLKGTDINLEYNWGATVNRAFEVGRTGNFLRDTKDKLAGLMGKKLYIPAYYDFEEEAFDNYMASVRGNLNQPAENAEYFLKTNSGLGINGEKSGQVMDNQGFYEILISSFDSFNFGEKQVTVKDDEPKVTVKDLESNLEEAEKIVFNDLKLVYEPGDEDEGKTKQEFILTKEQKLDFLEFDPKENELGFDKVSFKAYLEEIASNVNKLPKGQVSQVEGDRVVSFRLVEDGFELDKDATTEEFKDAYFGEKNIAYVKTRDVSGPQSAAQYGIYALLGEGRSKFTGSAQGRINNLTLAASRIDGVLVPPGSIFSFNDAVGEISAATGYDSAWIILGSKTVLGHGGGVCQTSTTMFRAILNAGLPVVTRHPHAYRVYYYEIESPIGIDASVYQPSLDLQFKNDTPNYVLIQTEWDLNEYELVFRLYGTPDGREVEITEPVVTNVTSAPPAEYRDDPTLPKGVVKQIDFAAGGASASFNRTVTKDGEVLYDDTFKTNYRPWRAVYLVGTKE